VRPKLFDPGPEAKSLNVAPFDLTDVEYRLGKIVVDQDFKAVLSCFAAEVDVFPAVVVL
jgi:hypothetical protein